MLTFGEKIKELRIQKKLTQKKLAINLGTTERTVQTYEANAKKPSFEALIAIADFFQVSMDYLCGRTDNLDLNSSTPIKRSSVYVSDADKELVRSCLTLDSEDKQIVLATAKAMLSRDKYSQLTRNPAGL